MERLLRIIVQAIGADDARRRIDKVVESERKLATATKEVAKETKAVATAANNWTLLGSKISRAEKEVQQFANATRKLSRNERDARFYNFFDNLGLPTNMRGATATAADGAGAVTKAVGGGRGRANNIANGILGLFGSGSRAVLGSAASGLRTLLGSIGQLAGASTAASMAIGGTIGVLATWPLTLGPIVMLGKGFSQTIAGIMDVLDTVYQSAIGKKIADSFEAVKKAVGPLTETVMNAVDPTGRLQSKLDDLFDKVGAWAIAVLPGVIYMFEKFVDVMLASIRGVANALSFFGDDSMLRFIDALELKIAETRFHNAAKDRFSGEHFKTPLPAYTDGMTLEQKKEALKEAYEKSTAIPDSESERRGLGESEKMRERKKAREERPMSRYDAQRLAEGALGRGF